MSKKNNGFFQTMAKYYYWYLIIKKFRSILKNQECKLEKNQGNTLSLKEKIRIIYIAVSIVLMVVKLLRSDKTHNDTQAKQ